MAEYRLSTHSGSVFTLDEFTQLYRDQYSVRDHKSILELWNELTPIEVPPDTDMVEFRKKMQYIYAKPNGPFDFLLYTKDPTRLLKLVPKNPLL